MMLAGRLLQEVGISAPRAITLTLSRDRYAGRMTARVLSFVMSVFILASMLAPSMVMDKNVQLAALSFQPKYFIDIM